MRIGEVGQLGFEREWRYVLRSVTKTSEGLGVILLWEVMANRPSRFAVRQARQWGQYFVRRIASGGDIRHFRNLAGRFILIGNRFGGM